MKKVILATLSLLLLYSCATPKLTNTVWCTIKEVSNEGQTGVLVESIYFLKDGKANVCRAILADSSLVVAPYKYADASYVILDAKSKDKPVRFDAINVYGDSLRTEGLVNVKKNILMLHGNEEAATVYVKNHNVIIE